MSKEVNSEAHCQIDIFIPIYIPKLGTISLNRNGLIHHFLQMLSEARYVPIVGVYVTVLLRQFLCPLSTCCIALDQLFQMLLLFVAHHLT
ncbi:hypothetical protein D3C77_694580 [compost metagenome]